MIEKSKGGIMSRILKCGCYSILALFLLIGCLGSAKKRINVPPLKGVGDLEELFLKHYKPVAEDFEPAMPSYALPVDVTRATNYNDVKRFISGPEQRKLIAKNGFVVVDGGVIDDITVPYEQLRKNDIPIYVTADTPLHLFHIQFDETLKEIEETVFYGDIVAVTRALLKAMDEDYKSFQGDAKEAAKRNVAYFSVALKQFDPDFEAASYVKDWVAWECEHIEKHEGLPLYETARERALFKIPEDYSQYKPRGHYTRSDTLKRYFRGMMWYGRMTFLMKGHEKFGPIIPPSEALLDRESARIQTIQAALIAARCGGVKIFDGRTVCDVWDRIYAVTAFYAGFADDLTLYDYREALREVFGSSFEASDMGDEAKFANFLFELLKRKPPAIFSGTGGAAIDPGGYSGHQFTSVQQLDNLLQYTMGFRFMGQRYIPDSYILGQLVSPGAGSIPGKIPPRFTSVEIYDERIQPDLCYTIRGFPRGLDVFSVFGSTRAEQHIVSFTDHEYPKYSEQVEKLRKEFGALTGEEWNRNLYWSWLYSLKTLVEERGKGYQTYQQTEAWLDRQLTTALASWSALRHNTILYAKQSYTPVFVGITSVQPIPQPPPPPKGLVEPLPEFYARILTTARMAYSGLKELEVLNDNSETRLASLVRMLETLCDICVRQVENEALTESDNEFLADFPEALKRAIGDVDEKGLKTTIIADVHSDLNTKQCLEEASGYVDYVIVAYKRAEGDVVLAVGPVLSYFEFKHPMKDRLTDETWQEMLNTGKVPERPGWIASYCIE
jgi:hypothetical protein